MSKTKISRPMIARQVVLRRLKTMTKGQQCHLYCCHCCRGCRFTYAAGYYAASLPCNSAIYL